MQYYVVRYSDELCHHGILGMKWGVRRYQNADGSLTEAGRKHYGRKLAAANKRINAAMEYRAIPKMRAEKVIQDELLRERYNSDNVSEKDKKRLKRITNYARVDAMRQTRNADFGSPEGSKGVLQYEQEYDKLHDKLYKKFGEEGMNQIRQYMKDAKLDIGEDAFSRATNYRKTYEQLYSKNQEKIEKIFKDKVSNITIDSSAQKKYYAANQ